MFNIEMSTGQKLQVGFIAAVLLVAGFLAVRSLRKTVDTSINAIVEPPRTVGSDPKLAVSARNPADPKKTTLTTDFWFHDGELRITEYTPESGMRADFVFTPDTHHTNYDNYKDPMARIQAISDPYKRVVTLAAYSVAHKARPMGLLAPADMDADQLKSEKEIRQVMLDQVTQLDLQEVTGAYHSEMYDKILAALAEFKALPGEPMKDAKKAAAAHKVVDLAMAYLDKLEAEKEAAVDKYVAGIDGILKPDQKVKVGEASKQLANRTPKFKPRAG